MFKYKSLRMARQPNNGFALEDICKVSYSMVLRQLGAANLASAFSRHLAAFHWPVVSGAQQAPPAVFFFFQLLRKGVSSG